MVRPASPCRALVPTWCVPASSWSYGFPGCVCVCFPRGLVLLWCVFFSLRRVLVLLLCSAVLCASWCVLALSCSAVCVLCVCVCVEFAFALFAPCLSVDSNVPRCFPYGLRFCCLPVRCFVVRVSLSLSLSLAREALSRNPGAHPVRPGVGCSPPRPHDVSVWPSRT